jgi:CIC family chloride channel protein
VVVFKLDGAVRYIRARYFQSDISRYIYHIVLSTLLGTVAGLGAILFNYLLEATRRFFAPGSFTSFFHIDQAFVFIIPVAGALIIALISRLFRGLARDPGVTGVIKAVIIKNGYIPFLKTVFHFLASIITIGSGAPLGPEGPAAKMGSGVGSAMAQLLRLGSKDMRMYTAAGAGAAISAIFNAPIAGVFFGIEVILLNDLKNQALSALIISSVVADIISRSVAVSVHVIAIPGYNPGSVGDLPLFFIMGILCGLASLLYFGIKKGAKRLIEEKLAIKNEFLKLLPLSIIFGLVITKYYSLFGMGYDTIGDVVAGRFDATTLIMLFSLYTVFFALYVSAGAFGGTFAPSLVMGVMLGYAFALIMNSTFGLALDPVTFALIGMGGILAGINSIPLTAIMLVFETTGDYKFILPLMLVSIISYIVTIYYNKGTVYARELLEAGIDVSKRGEVDLLGRVKAGDLMDRDFQTVDYRTPFRKLTEILLSSNYGSVVVVDKKKKLLGIITLNDIKQALMSEDLVDLLIAADLYNEAEAVIEGDKVSEALRTIERQNLDMIPVVKGEGSAKITGVLTHQRITQAYNTLLDEWEMDQFILEHDGKRREGSGTS